MISNIVKSEIVVILYIAETGMRARMAIQPVVDWALDVVYRWHWQFDICPEGKI